MVNERKMKRRRHVRGRKLVDYHGHAGCVAQAAAISIFAATAALATLAAASLRMATFSKGYAAAKRNDGRAERQAKEYGGEAFHVVANLG